MAGSHLDVDGRRVAVTNLPRVLYPETGTRKFDVLSYYLAVADVMLPHLASRPITRKRWPSGVDAAPFFEKALPSSAPDWLARFTIEHSSEEKSYPVARSAADLVWLAQMAALELHVPQWRIDLSDDDARRADRLVLDLDPGPGVPLTQCAQVALTIRDVLHDAGLASYPVTSGGKGIHVYARFPAPVKSDSARAVAKQIATSLAKQYPDDVTASMTKTVREARVFIDWSQNSSAKTTLSPYSLRGREQPWVAAPRSWSELSDPDLGQLLYTEVVERVRESGDLLAGLDGPRPVDDDVVHLGAYRRAREKAAKSRRPAPPPKPPAAEATAAAPLRPMLATDEAIDGLDSERWAFEGKWDGYRMIVSFRNGHLRLQSRSGIDMTADFPQLAEIGDCCEGHDVVLDGEVVAVNDSGRTDFTLLASRRRTSDVPVRLYLFDVLSVDDAEFASVPWERRREVLEEVGEWFSSSTVVEVPPLLDGPGDAALSQAREAGWEGVVAKRRSSLYRPGRRSPDWRKQKNWNDIEVVIGGYRLGRGERGNTIGSLLIGLPEETGLRYVGRVGTGFTEAQLNDLLDELRPLEIKTCPFVDRLDRPVASSATWVLPKLVADIRFMDWTSTGHLRHPSWRGIRRDKLPGDL